MPAGAWEGATAVRPCGRGENPGQLRARDYAVKRPCRNGNGSNLASVIRGPLSATTMLGDYLEFRVQFIGGSAHDRETGRTDAFNEGLDSDTGHLGRL